MSDKFSRTWETVKYVAGKTIKWAALGAIVGAIAFALVPGIVTLPVLGPLSILFPSVAAKGIWAIVMPGLMLGAAGGGLFGSLKGISGAGEAVQEKYEDYVADHQQERGLAMRQQMLAQQQQAPSQGGGLMSSLGLGRGKGQEMGR